MIAPADTPNVDLESVLHWCTYAIALGDDFETYRERTQALLRHSFPDRGGDAEQMAHDAGLANILARAVWKQCPHPAHRYAAAPLRTPERNMPCHCGSGRKYKQCCQMLEAELPELGMNFLIPLMESLPKSRWAELADSRVSIDMMTDLAVDWSQAGRADDVAKLLEPWFNDDRHMTARYEPLLDLLLGAYLDRHNPRKKAALLERAMASGDATIRSAALQRRASMAADQGDYPAAWALFQQAQRNEPDSLSLSHLEVTLLLSQGRDREARERARFWLLRLARRNDPDLQGLIDFLRNVAEEGGGAMVTLARQNDTDVEWLLGLWEQAPPLTALYTLDPSANDAGPLKPKRGLAGALSAWNACFEAVDYSPLRQNAFDWWEDADTWLPVLRDHPQLWNSFEALDGIVHALQELPYADVAERLAQPLLERGEALLREVLRTNKSEGKTLEWGWMENRPALNLLGQLIQFGLDGDLDDATIARMEWLVGTLNRNDNQGFRQKLMRAYLQRERFDDALALSDRYPDDFAAMRYNRALALFALGRGDDAGSVLRDAVAESPKLLKYLLAADPKQPKSDGWGVRMGGNEEAWLYRESHLALWQRHDSLAWAKRVTDKRRKQQG